MARGTKRGAAEESTSSRATKVAKTPKSTTKKAAPSKAPLLTGEQFKAKALPLHINITHTPPSIQTEEEVDAEKEKMASDAGEVGIVIRDVGSIGNATLLPTIFSTGSYGWKGSKRITVELQGGDDVDGAKEKVQVILSINATVLNSKPKAKGKGKAAAEAEDEEEEDDDGGDEEAAQE